MVASRNSGSTDVPPPAARICAAHQPNLLPWAGFMAKVYRADVFVIADTVQYVKQNFVNRCKIPRAGKAHWLSIPVEKSGRFGQRQKDVHIDYTQPWRKKFTGTLRHLYGKSALYPVLGGAIEAAIDEECEYLIDLNVRLLSELTALLGITTRICKLSELKVTSQDRCRRIVELTVACGCNHYLAGKGASMHYLVDEPFLQTGISYSYHSFSEPPYEQADGEFTGGCSIVDSLFRCGVPATRGRIGMEPGEKC
ncbi:MAG: hypothetical protein GF398_15235 [Chitinivibrionales bacterium]|nr:hypothetical protein [Chitinivibrionales bacterium]